MSGSSRVCGRWINLEGQSRRAFYDTEGLDHNQSNACGQCGLDWPRHGPVI